MEQKEVMLGSISLQNLSIKTYKDSFFHESNYFVVITSDSLSNTHILAQFGSQLSLFSFILLIIGLQHYLTFFVSNIRSHEPINRFKISSNYSYFYIIHKIKGKNLNLPQISLRNSCYDSLLKAYISFDACSYSMIFLQFSSSFYWVFEIFHIDHSLQHQSH